VVGPGLRRDEADKAASEIDLYHTWPENPSDALNFQPFLKMCPKSQDLQLRQQPYNTRINYCLPEDGGIGSRIESLGYVMNTQFKVRDVE
jgi:hypothetical protein